MLIDRECFPFCKRLGCPEFFLCPMHWGDPSEEEDMEIQ